MRDRWWGVVDVGGIGPRVIDLMDPQTGVEKEREKKRIYKNNVDNVFDPC